MSERTGQCEECATVFEAAPRGIIPKLCPDCRKQPAATPSAPAKRGKRKAKASGLGSSPAIATAIVALQEEIETLEAQITSRREALEALEAVA